MSGYVPETARLKEVTGAVYVPKPFTPTELLRAVAEVLPRSGSAERVAPPEPPRPVAVDEARAATP
jgi:DNA-binding response OmpR family regulator